MAKIYIDSNIFIAVFSGAEPNSLKSRQILEAIAFGSYYGVSSVLLQTEVYKGNEAIDNFISNLPNFSLKPVDYKVARMAQEFRLKHKILKTADALHIATAVVNDCDCLVSDDKQLLKVAKKHLEAYSSTDFEL